MPAYLCGKSRVRIATWNEFSVHPAQALLNSGLRGVVGCLMM
jgi:hypothetical protein